MNDREKLEQTAGAGAGSLLATFLFLLGLTGAELWVATTPAERAARITALAGLLMLKAGVVLMLFMHGRSRLRVSWLVFAGLAVGVGYAVVLMMEAAFRARLS